MDQRYYYWDPLEKSKNGETLSECLALYGTGSQNLNKHVRYDVLFLDESRSFGNAWMLRAYNRSTKDNVPVTLYEKNPEHKVYGKCPRNIVGAPSDR